MTYSQGRCEIPGGMNANNLGETAEKLADEHIRPQSESIDEDKTNRTEEADGRVYGTEEYEDLTVAPPSVRAAMLGKGDRKSEEAGSSRQSEQSEEDRIEEEGGVSFGQEYSEERCVQVRMPAVRPSSKDIAKHNLTHVPFRPWCEVCVSEEPLMRIPTELEQSR